MLYLSPEKDVDWKWADRGRILYADTYPELLTAIHKLDMPVVHIKKEPVLHYKLSKGRAWQLIRLKDDGFVELEELTLLQEQEYVRRNTEDRIQKTENRTNLAT